MKLSYVEWEDSHTPGNDDWRSVDEIEPKRLVCHTVGWIFKQSKTEVVIIHSFTNDWEGKLHNCMGFLTIPLGAILTIKPLHFNGKPGSRSGRKKRTKT